MPDMTAADALEWLAIFAQCEQHKAHKMLFTVLSCRSVI
jgi:hypothetical protein